MKIKHVLLSGIVLLAGTGAALAATQTITGAGATFPYPLYVKWAQQYQQQTGVNVNYQPIGSGGGIQQIKSQTVNFGASDKPLSTSELQQAHLMQFPTVVGGVAAVVNLVGLKKPLVLSGPVLADIYQGKITTWNDPKIIALNPGVTLPATPITVVHRSDGSGTTFLFTHYLSDVSPAWKIQIGADTAVAWSTGVGGKGNEGVAAYVQRIQGSIGYVEYAYAQQNQLNYVQLINQSGHAVAPSLNTFASAAAYAHWSTQNNFAEILTNEPGTDSWPIVGATFILLNSLSSNTQQTAAVLQFFNWSFQNGKDAAKDLNYVMLPNSVIKLIQQQWREQLNYQVK